MRHLLPDHLLPLSQILDNPTFSPSPLPPGVSPPGGSVPLRLLRYRLASRRLVVLLCCRNRNKGETDSKGQINMPQI
ncbi:hypothetical protein U1Q18_016801 [Sarracenia purpurea var. burkii]